MPDMKLHLLLLAGLLPQPVCHASDLDTMMLQINPFLRPALEAVLPDSEKTTADTEPGGNMQLRGTMLAGSNSLANIDGSIIGIGQQVYGYTLISVQQRHVMLDRNGTQMMLSIDSEAGSDD